MDIKLISAEQTLALRHKVLWPNKPVAFCRVPGDDTALHFGAYVDQQLVCVASIFIDGCVARLRKYATDQAFQGQGIGSAVLRHVLAHLHSLSVLEFWCDARLSALDFYARFGMRAEGEHFFKSDVEYRKMRLRLPFSPC